MEALEINVIPKALAGRARNFRLEGDLLYYVADGRRRLCVPQGSLREKLLAEYHDAPTAAHQGIERTFLMLSARFFWPSMARIVKQYVLSCDSCQRNKASTHIHEGLLQSLSLPGDRWESVSMDFVGPLPATRDGHDRVMVVVDRMTKRTRFIPAREDDTAERTAWRFLDNVVKIHGVPRSIVSDRDKLFDSAFWRALMQSMGTKLKMSTVDHPQTDGQTERANRTMEEMLRHYVSHAQSDWDVYLPLAEIAVNSATASSTGMSPYELDLGRSPTTPADLLLPPAAAPEAREFAERMNANLGVAKDAIAAAQARQAQYANVHRREHDIQTGELVMVALGAFRDALQDGRTCAKLGPKYSGPYKVLELIGKNALRVDLPATTRQHNVINISKIKRYTPNDDELFPARALTRPAPVVDEQQQERYEVERIVGARTRYRRREYLVHWTGYGEHERTWEDAERMKADAPEAVLDFEAQQAGTNTAQGTLAPPSNSGEPTAEAAENLQHAEERPATQVVDGGADRQQDRRGGTLAASDSLPASAGADPERPRLPRRDAAVRARQMLVELKQHL